MTFDETAYRAFVRELFRAKNEGPDGFMHAAAGLAGESGEVLDHVKKLFVYNKQLPRAEMIEEMGDVFHYFTMLCLLLDVSMSEVTAANIDKLRKRYPNGFSREAAIARADKVEN